MVTKGAHCMCRPQGAPGRSSSIVRRTRVFCALVILGCAAPICVDAQAVAGVSARIKSFYSWYLLERAAQRDPVQQSGERMREYVTVLRMRALERAQRGGTLTRDYFLTTQDWPDAIGSDVMVSRVRRNGHDALADVRLSAPGVATQRLEVVLNRAGGRWKIAAVRPSVAPQ